MAGGEEGGRVEEEEDRENHEQEDVQEIDSQPGQQKPPGPSSQREHLGEKSNTGCLQKLGLRKGAVVSLL